MRSKVVGEGKSNALYSLAIVGFALGGLLLIGTVTGNVVGLGGGTSVVGAVLIVLGIVVALLLSRKRKGTF